MRKLTGHLLRLLDDLPNDRLLLRVASRATAFPSRLREELSARFEESYRELDLAPLTWGDAALAAAAASEGGDEHLPGNRGLDVRGAAGDRETAEKPGVRRRPPMRRPMPARWPGQTAASRCAAIAPLSSGAYAAGPR
jgi:hypothetical protein